MTALIINTNHIASAIKPSKTTYNKFTYIHSFQFLFLLYACQVCQPRTRGEMGDKGGQTRTFKYSGYIRSSQDTMGQRSDKGANLDQ